MMGDLLEAVVAAAKRAADERERRISRDALERSFTPAGRGGRFESALGAGGIRVIAECKRRSPSKGVLRVDYDPAAIAAAYAEAGASAISVLTEPTFFDGSLEHLRQVRSRVSIPLLRKDFIVTEYQVVEAASAGADAVLLIVAALETSRLEKLLSLAGALGLDALVEVHDHEELSRAVAVGARVIGVNSRNLRTLEVDLRIFDDLSDAIPDAAVAVAESGLRRAADLRRLHELGYDAFLIGERFMSDANPGAALSSLLTSVEVGTR